MKRVRLFLILLGILLMVGIAGIFDFPDYANRGIDLVNAAKNRIPFLSKVFNIPQVHPREFQLGLDLQGGVHLVYEADLSSVEKIDYDSAMESLRDAIERRVNFFGVSEPVVQIEGRAEKRRLIVELAGVIDPNQAIKLIGDTPFLEFKVERLSEEQKQRLEKFLSKELTIEESDALCQRPDSQFLFIAAQAQGEDPCFQSLSPPFTGSYLKRAEVDLSQPTQPSISLQFNDEGSKRFKEMTEQNIGKPIAIYLDNVLEQAPVVQSVIPDGAAQITGTYTLEEARIQVKRLNTGALPVRVSLISQQSVGATLGKISLEKSLKAAMVGFLLVAGFMVLLYRIPGILATIALVVYVALVLAVFKLIAVTITLAGIAGFILSVGMAVDANILIFSRMREELKDGKSFVGSVEEGFRRAWPSIRDGNITTMLVALLLFWLGSSFIQGFAFTLLIGILISMFSAIFVTKSLLGMFVGTPFEKIQWLWK